MALAKFKDLDLDQNNGDTALRRQSSGVPWIAGYASAYRRDHRLNKCIGDNALIEKAVTSQSAAITCPISRFYIQVNNFRFARHPATIAKGWRCQCGYGICQLTSAL